MKKKRVTRAGSFLLCAALIFLLTAVFSACGKKENAGGTGLTVSGGELIFREELDAATFQAHAGQTLCLYELKPGETLASLSGRTPVVQTKVAANIRVKFPLLDGNGETRLYSSFAAAFSDGLLLSQSAYSVGNPEALASDRSQFPNTNNIKGMNSGDVSLYPLLYSGHTVVELRASLLTAESGTVAAADSPLLEETDSKVLAACKENMQVSLCVIPDAGISLPDYAVLFDRLAERYSGKDAGTVSAFLIGEDSSGTEETLAGTAFRRAELFRIARTALRSRFANGRVYLCVSGNLNGVKELLLETDRQTVLKGGSPVNIAFCPEPTVASLQKPSSGGGEPMCLSDLPKLAQYVYENIGRNVRFAVSDLAIPADDVQLQAALYTYAYRACRQINADFMIYRTPEGAATGLYDENRSERPAARAFRYADTAFNSEGEALAASRLGSDWSALLSVSPDRLYVEDVANAGTTGDAEIRLFDFQGKNNPVFTLSGYGSAPALSDSNYWNSKVLTALLTDSGFRAGSGIRHTFEHAKELQNSHVLSARLMAQTVRNTGVTATLRLDGTATDGRPLSYQSSILLESNNWETVTFHIRGFTAVADTSAPVTMTILLLPESSGDSTDGAPAPDGAPAETFALWLHSVNIRRAAPDHTLLIIFALILSGFALGFLLVSLIARKRRKR